MVNKGYDKLIAAGEKYAADHELILSRADIARFDAFFTTNNMDRLTAGAAAYYIALGIVQTAEEPEKELPWN